MVGMAVSFHRLGMEAKSKFMNLLRFLTYSCAKKPFIIFGGSGLESTDFSQFLDK